MVTNGENGTGVLGTLGHEKRKQKFGKSEINVHPMYITIVYESHNARPNDTTENVGVASHRIKDPWTKTNTEIPIQWLRPEEKHHGPRKRKRQS